MPIELTVFAQVMDFLPMHAFRRCVERYQGNRKVQSFKRLDQFFCMAFAQLTYRESLRDADRAPEDGCTEARTAMPAAAVVRRASRRPITRLFSRDPVGIANLPLVSLCARQRHKES